jgi:hypothetical protein
MLHIDDDDGDDDVDHYYLEVLEDKVNLLLMMMKVEFVEMVGVVVLNLMDAYYHPYH